METEIVGDAVVDVEQALDAPVVEPDSQPEVQPELDAEQIARQSGWTPKEEFKGDPNKWKEADAWNDTAMEIMPILKANNSKLHENLSKISADNKSLKKQVSDLVLATTEISKREYDKAMAEITAKQRDATVEGDIEAFDALEKQKEGIKPPTQGVVPQTEPPVISEWKERNQWYGVDKEKTDFAEFLCAKYTGQGYTVEQQLYEVDKHFASIKSDRRSTPTVVAKSSAQPVIKKSKYTYNDLPPDAKAVCDDLCDSIEGYKKETYVQQLVDAGFFEETK